MTTKTIAKPKPFAGPIAPAPQPAKPNGFTIPAAGPEVNRTKEDVNILYLQVPGDQAWRNRVKSMQAKLGYRTVNAFIRAVVDEALKSQGL